MPEIGNLTRQKPTQASIELGDGDMVQITFDRNAVTPAWMDEAQRRATENADALALAKSLSAVMIDWDVTDESRPFPPTATNIAILSFDALRALLELIVSAAIPGVAEGNASNVMSSSVEQSSTLTPATRQNGPTHSPSPQPSTFPSTS